ncbi:FAD-dependent oxidoreductase [Caminibacter pacificus]|jgi:pyruvate/2-oxoglutarate dehydrogenase complex dihydrolipoamide dehydrogenase (E3) component
MIDVLVIGGGVAGFVSAINAKQFYPQKRVVLIEKNPKKLVPCGIPYIFNTFSIDDDLMNLEKKLKKHGVELIEDEIKEIDFQNKEAIANEKYKFDKLIIATGSKPKIPPIQGIKNAYFIKKEYDYLKNLLEKTKNAKNITIIGGGFIGLEVADELAKNGKNIMLIEMMKNILPNSFDEDFSKKAQESLHKNITLKLNARVEKIGKNYVLVDDEKIASDLTIVTTGFSPNTEFLDVEKNEFGFIKTDEYLRVKKDIFAVGDCVEHKEFFTANPTPLMLASTAAFDARVAAANLYSLQIIRHNKDSLNIYSTVIGDKVFAAVGITENMAKKEGFEVIVTKAKSYNTHPPKFSHSTDVEVKLIFSKKDLYLLGAQIVGGISTGEMINILGLAIQKNATASDLYTMQIGTHPLLTPPPTLYPIAVAAGKALV